jgi:hypothetical protein
MNNVQNTLDTYTFSTVAKTAKKVKAARTVPNQFRFNIDGTVTIVATSKGQQIEFLIDQADYARVSEHQWSVAWRENGPYAVTTIDSKKTYLHRFLLGASKGEVVDHKDRNSLNHRRNNLRFSNTAGNCQNRSRHRNNSTGFLGVHPTASGRYRAQVSAFGRRVTVGVFDTALTAAVCRDLTAIRLQGAHASLNFPSLGEAIEDAVQATQQLDEKVAA